MQQTGTKLIAGVRIATWTSPGMKHLYIRKPAPRGNPRCEVVENSTNNAVEANMMEIISCLDKMKQDEAHDDLFCDTLDQLDSHMRENPRVRAMISTTASDKIGKLSIMAECIRLVNLHSRTPGFQSFSTGHKHCDDTLPEINDLFQYGQWRGALMEAYRPLLSAIDVPQGCLRYPAHHYPNRQNIEQMRAAEKNLDAFWADLDHQLMERTGQAQHYLIQPHFVGEMRRTPPWIKDKSSGTKHVYVPFSTFSHDVSKQVTGVFDNSAGAGHTKTKTKTRGELTFEIPNVAPVAPVAPAYIPENQTEILQRIIVDKRKHKTIKTIFGMHAQAGDVPKVVRWDEFKRTMIRIGFSAEKLQGPAWQFTPHGNTDIERAIQFHEPHPNNDIVYRIARRSGRRLERAYGWTGETFELA